MLPCCRLAFGPGVTVSRKAGRLETEQKLPRGRGGRAEHAGVSPPPGLILRPPLGFPPRLFQVSLVSVTETPVAFSPPASCSGRAR